MKLTVVQKHKHPRDKQNRLPTHVLQRAQMFSKTDNFMPIKCFFWSQFCSQIPRCERDLNGCRIPGAATQVWVGNRFGKQEHFALKTRNLQYVSLYAGFSWVQMQRVISK